MLAFSAGDLLKCPLALSHGLAHIDLILCESEITKVCVMKFRASSKKFMYLVRIIYMR